MRYLLRRSVLLVSLVSLWIFALGVEAQKTPPSCSTSQRGGIRATTNTGQSNGNCAIVNLTNIEVCESDGWREICDEEFTNADAKVICRELSYSDIGASAGRVAGQFSGGFLSTEYPQCSGQESTLSECPMTGRNEGPCAYNKVIVICYMSGADTSGSMCGISTEFGSNNTGRVTTGEPSSTTTPESAVHHTGTTTHLSSEHITGTRNLTLDTGQESRRDPTIVAVIAACTTGFFIIIITTIIIVVLCLCRHCRLKHSVRCSQLGAYTTETEVCLHTERIDSLLNSESLQHEAAEETALYETIKDSPVGITVPQLSRDYEGNTSFV